MKQERIKKAQSMSKKIIREFLIENTQHLIENHGIISVVDVIISSDLSYLDIQISCLKNEETLAKSLADFAHPIQHILGKKIDFLKVPRVRFRKDDSLKESSHIYDILNSLDIDEKHEV